MAGLLRNLSGIDLYWFATKMQLPLKSITEEFKVRKIRPIDLKLQNRKDEKVRRT